MAFIGKEYKFDRQENFDGFLRAVGLPEEQVAKFIQFKPSSTLVKDGDKYKYITKTEEHTRESTFQPGVEFDDTVGDSKTPIKSKYTIDGNTVIQNIKADNKSAIFKREYNGDELVVTITASEWDGVARRYYKA
ncbi:hypothetical protein K1T71_011339 [Dendrolimus kikuchii]|uniref:Uncharacterized protein n=1 Tax=Dendrolimus kikuchii TaxID=765133 RepID=A0ACC1CNI2_9NEOP|nr:hypothetical protein K1T71_011339 [Dendrolimus kikuchii]